mmetsp:Transcript_53177/g.129124  ORF Transcript_53177/g.129124 Transcript_53177/m.129124 type:complete len:409 (-) Transcript_53177:1413-2639(-)|eukprot:CAMPEP_0113455122 /NCGR_PEP_ID=MMETSP0014_2-20120614/8213_1 /TAXON_ID=2857 /ORGANISM="Nitzschia sp." /LENGTH=408 /DNA_ID=CAMNT_0000346543 /DNA_START=91 /DNA_END=1317 /DNA_ORIENTATION=+ /assembly_acc=CAM_ASM_000159
MTRANRTSATSNSTAAVMKMTRMAMGLATAVVLADAHGTGIGHRRNNNNYDNMGLDKLQVRVGAKSFASKSKIQNIRILQEEEQDNVGEGQQKLSMTFSLWHPDMNLFLSGGMMTEEEQEEAFQTLLGTTQGPVLKSLQEFFCEDTALVVIDDENFENVCDSSGNRNRNRGLQLSPDPENSYIASIPSNLLVSPFSTVNEDGSTTTNGEEEQDDVDVVYWWTWNVNYRLEQIGTQVIEQANVMNVTDHRQYLQDVTQLALDVSIMEGFMDERLSGTSVYMAMVGLETDMFQDAAERYANGLDSNGSSAGDGGGDSGSSSLDYTDADLGTNGLILRYIGVALLVVDFVVVTALTLLARRRRRHIEETRGHKSHHAPRLVTEKAVNQMLETGRRESEKYVAQSSQPQPQS